MNPKHDIWRSADLKQLYSEAKRDFPCKDYYSLACNPTRIASVVTKFLPGGSRVLDFGAGHGVFAVMLSKLDYETHAWDVLSDPWHLQDKNRGKLLNFYSMHGVRFELIQQDNLPLPNVIFDGIVFSNVIEHLHNSPLGLLIELTKRLKSGGYIFVNTPNAVNVRKRISVLFGGSNYPPINKFLFWPSPWTGHVREYTLSELIKVLESVGIRLVHAECYDGMLEARLNSRMLQELFKIFTCAFPTLKDSLLVIGEKTTDWSPPEIHYTYPPRLLKRP